MTMSSELPEMRVSDAERERVAEVLRTAVADGRLDLEEFGERLDAAYKARTRGELEPLVRDLPAPSAPAPAVDARVGGRPTSSLGVAVMGGFRRHGRWTVPRRFTSFAFWGGGQIDLREASFEDGEVTIRCVAIMGGIQVVVPPGLDVRVDGVGIMGGFDSKGAGEGAADAPAVRVRVTGLAFWGGVEVVRRAGGESEG
ncbi:hypothetical protein GCM10010357_56660 [Streptomyces luteireticuli]|uniref:DUF1707 domain-containing protein n=2 Tax=Streptomyces luteireticuli TaxID=173858 RepID=A0ABP3IW93_9ACTN